MTIDTTIKVGICCIVVLFAVCCRPGGRRGDTEPAVARRQCSVASGKALVMLHWTMPHVLLQRLRTAIEMAWDGGAVIIAKDHVMVH